MKKRYMEVRDHKVIDDYSFQKKYVDIKEFKGYVGLVNVNHTLDDWYVPRDDGSQVCILKSGFKWLEFYPDGAKHAITAIYNEEGKLVEWYFDMVKEFGMENGMPYMMDLYLDLVITPKGEIYVLDEDELQEAVQTKDITEADYQMAHQTLDMLLEKYDNGNNIVELENLTDKYLKEFEE